MYKNSREKTAKQLLSSQKTANLPPTYKNTQNILPNIKSTTTTKTTEPKLPKRNIST
jgi:hypothetical protein